MNGQLTPVNKLDLESIMIFGNRGIAKSRSGFLLALYIATLFCEVQVLAVDFSHRCGSGLRWRGGRG